MTRIAGLPNTNSQRAFDMFVKVRDLMQRGGRFMGLTGTPISNTMAETFTLQRYFSYDQLVEMGLSHFELVGTDVRRRGDDARDDAGRQRFPSEHPPRALLQHPGTLGDVVAVHDPAQVQGREWSGRPPTSLLRQAYRRQNPWLAGS